MFEMSCAAARCMNSSALPSSLLLAVSISAPCILEDISSVPTRNHKMLSCSVAYSTGRMEVRSFTAASSLVAAAGQRGQLHLGGWAGQAAAAPSSHQEQPRHRVTLLGGLVVPAVGGRAELPTAVANLMSEPVGTCGQPGGYAVHPAALDSATHTAAAFSGQDATDKGERFTLCLSHRNSAINLPVAQLVHSAKSRMLEECCIEAVCCHGRGDTNSGGARGFQCSCGRSFCLVHGHPARLAA